MRSIAPQDYKASRSATVARTCMLCGKELRFYQKLFCSMRCLNENPMTPKLAARLIRYWGGRVNDFLRGKRDRD